MMDVSGVVLGLLIMTMEMWSDKTGEVEEEVPESGEQPVRAADAAESAE